MATAKSAKWPNLGPLGTLHKPKPKKKSAHTLYIERSHSAVRWASARVGTVESGGDNRGRLIQAWQDNCGFGPGTAWCQIFVNNSFKAAVGRNLPWYPGTGGSSAHTITVHDNAPRLTAKTGWGRFTDPRLVRPGDWVYMYWPPSGRGHVGIARSGYKNGLIYTIEGNTHRQGGGGREGVWKKQHAPSELHGYLRPPYARGRWNRG